jgi:hypothetical protein
MFFSRTTGRKSFSEKEQIFSSFSLFLRVKESAAVKCPKKYLDTLSPNPQ